MATPADTMRERCHYLIEMTRRTERDTADMLPETLADMAIIRFALHKLSQPNAPDDIRECAQFLADMKWGDTSPHVGANTLSELGRLAIVGLEAEESEWNTNDEGTT